VFEKGPPGAGGGLEGNPNMAITEFFGKFSRVMEMKRPMEKKKMLIKEAMPLLLEMEVRGEGKRERSLSSRRLAPWPPITRTNAGPIHTHTHTHTHTHIHT
jgi:hypothetical protein